MIDLLKNYKELKNAPGYMNSLRYYLAKKKLDTFFVKWLYSNQETVDQMIQKATAGKLKATEEPNPLFSHHKIPINSLHLNSSAILSSTISPPRSSIDDKDSQNRKSMNETYAGGSMARSTILAKSLHNEMPLGTTQIPQFYFPKGKPTDPLAEKATLAAINTAIGANTVEISNEMSKKLLETILNVPLYFSKLLIARGTSTADAEKMSRAEFLKIWRVLQGQTPSFRAFWLLCSDPNKKHVTPEDFKQLFKEIMQTHPGLQFLKQTPEFQEWYSLCAIHRMYYMANRKYDYKMTFRQFKSSNIFKSLRDIEVEPDINRNTDFFSYEDFYVIYIKFWELDNDHDFQLGREELSKYSGYTLSRKTLERIFSQSVRKFQHEEKMGFGDFVWFILCVEDKTTLQSIEFWFKIMDLDGNGVITGYELEYFFQEQSQRLSYQESNLDFNFQNILCQMVDIFKNSNSIHFTLQDFLTRKADSSIFINMLTDLNKLIGFEQRDAYQERNVKVDNPDWNEWDRFVKPEYRRIECAQENDDGGQVLNWENDD